MRAADYRIFNLEVLLTNIESPIAKCGPNLIASTEVINGYKGICVNPFAISNNHIIDHCEQGLAFAAMAGAAIAKADPLVSGINASKLAIAAFLLPYMFVLNPQLLMLNVA